MTQSTENNWPEYINKRVYILFLNVRFSKPKGGETRPVANGLFSVMDKTICGIIVVVFFFVCLFSKNVDDDFDGGY